MNKQLFKKNWKVKTDMFLQHLTVSLWVNQNKHIFASWAFSVPKYGDFMVFITVKSDEGPCEKLLELTTEVPKLEWDQDGGKVRWKSFTPAVNQDG